MKHIEDEAKKTGLKRLRLLTNEKAHWALNFQKKLDYERVGKMERP